MENNRIFNINIDGNDNECEILFTYHSENFNKDYCFFTVLGDEDEGVTVMSFDPTDGEEGMLHSVDTDEEWNELEDVLASWQEDTEEDSCCSDSCCSCSDSCCCCD